MLMLDHDQAARRHKRAATRCALVHRFFRRLGGRTVPGASLLGTVTRAARAGYRDHTTAYRRHCDRMAASNRIDSAGVGHA